MQRNGDVLGALQRYKICTKIIQFSFFNSHKHNVTVSTVALWALSGLLNKMVSKAQLQGKKTLPQVRLMACGCVSVHSQAIL